MRPSAIEGKGVASPVRRAAVASAQRSHYCSHPLLYYTTCRRDVRSRKNDNINARDVIAITLGVHRNIRLLLSRRCRHRHHRKIGRGCSAPEKRALAGPRHVHLARTYHMDILYCTVTVKLTVNAQNDPSENLSLNPENPWNFQQDV